MDDEDEDDEDAEVYIDVDAAFNFVRSQLGMPPSSARDAESDGGY